MDEQTVQHLLLLFQHMEINHQNVVNVRDQWFPTHIGMKTFRVVTTDEQGGNPEIYCISFPETFQFPPEGTSEAAPVQEKES
jgi:hypothetical protein